MKRSYRILTQQEIEFDIERFLDGDDTEIFNMDEGHLVDKSSDGEYKDFIDEVFTL